MRLEDFMTSELLLRAIREETPKNDREEFQNEYQRRMDILELSQEQKKKFYEMDIVAIEKGCYITLDSILASKPYIGDDEIVLSNCTFSELIYLTEEADYEYIRNGEGVSVSEKAWETICKHALNGGLCESAIENRKRLIEAGLSEEQQALFVKNECLIIRRLRWQMTEEVAW